MKKIIDKLKNIGPGALVAAAFIGPGTVTTCTKSGASSGYTLLWAMLFSIIATIIFQEMSARLGIITGKGLGENIREKIHNPIFKYLAITIVLLAIFIGNIAYETGNVTGGTLGVEVLMPSIPSWIWAPLLGILTFILLWSGSYKKIEKFLIALVILMSGAFLFTAIASKPDIVEIFKGMFTPKVGSNDWMTVIGLIGTTVVPYNLFLHSSSAAERWSNKEDLKSARLDTILSIGLGGIISMCIIIAASANLYGTGAEINSGVDMALAVEPILGSWAKWLIGIGLFAAGFTSTITAPLSAAFATTGVLNLNNNMKSIKFKFIWIIVLFIGIALATFGQSSPTELILVAQAANAIILPIIAIFLMYCMNDKSLGQYKNKPINNVLGIIIIIITILLCIRNLSSFINSLEQLI